MNWVQIHLALNHVPVIGLPLMVFILVAGWWRKNDDVQRLALWSLVLLSNAAVVIKFTGDFAAEQATQRLEAVSEWVGRHEKAGDQATTGVFFLGLSAALALFLARRGRPVRAWSLGLVVALGIGSGFLFARTAHSGGQISHIELRPAVR